MEDKITLFFNKKIYEKKFKRNKCFYWRKYKWGGGKEQTEERKKVLFDELEKVEEELFSNKDPQIKLMREQEIKRRDLDFTSIMPRFQYLSGTTLKKDGRTLKEIEEQAIKIIRQLKELGTTSEEFEEYEKQAVKNIIEKDPTQASLKAWLKSENDLKNKA